MIKACIKKCSNKITIFDISHSVFTEFSDDWNIQCQVLFGIKTQGKKMSFCSEYEEALEGFLFYCFRV